MPGSLQPRVKTWVDDEDVTYSDLNAEFDNVLTAMQPTLIDDYSANVTQMQVTADPGEVGTESVATTLAGELARIRYMLKEITGKTQWYESPVSSLAGLANAVGTGLTDNRLVSGRVRTGSQMPIFLVPHGSARTVTLKGATTNFLYFVEGTQYTIDADVTLTNLTLAPSSNNTCLVNDTVAADQDWTKYAGEDGSEITVDNVGSEITSLVGKLAGFKLDNGSASEYFVAEVGTNKLIKAKRGYCFDNADAPIPRIVYSNNDTITLMKLTWVFAKTDETLTATYNPPTWSKDEPSSPAIGDYWFDLDANKWKVYGVGSFSDADAILVGICMQDTSNTVAARSFEFFANYSADNTIEIMYDTASQVRSRFHGAVINVWGTTIKNDHGLFAWDMGSHRDTGVSESSSTYYFYYITEEGDVIISNIRPYDRRGDLLGHYHPHQSWRCVGWAFNNSSSDLGDVNSFFTREQKQPILPAQTATSIIEVIDKVIPLDSSGGVLTKHLPAAAFWRGQEITFLKTSSDVNAITLDAYGAETIRGATTFKLCMQNELVTLFSDGTNIHITRHDYPRSETANGVLTITATTSNPTKGTTASDQLYWARDGKYLIGRLDYRQSALGSAAAGSGDYLFTVMPTGWTIDTTNMVLYTTVVGGANHNPSNAFGFGSVSVLGGSPANMAASVYVYDNTKIRLGGPFVGGGVGGTAMVNSANFSLNNATISYMAHFRVPITNWEG